MRFLIILLFGVYAQCSFGQINTIQEEFVFIDTLPEYPGGMRVLKRTIKNNLIYPVEAYNDEVTGIVKCGFVIDTNGNVTKLKIVDGVRKDIDSEALRIMGTLLRWAPAVHDGIKVSVYQTIEIEFIIDRKTRRKMNNT